MNDDWNERLRDVDVGRPRSGFESDLRQRLTAEWNGEVTTVESRPPMHDRGVRLGWLLGAAVVATLVVAGVAVATRQPTDSVQTPASDSVPVAEPSVASTTAPTAVTTTVEEAPATVVDGADTSTTEPPESVPTTVAPAPLPDPVATTQPDVVPGSTATACVERFAEDAQRPTVEPQLSEFTTIGREPALSVITAGAYPADLSVRPRVAHIPGGILLSASISDDTFDGSPSSSEERVTAINWDGSIRWQRCFDGNAYRPSVAPAELKPSVVWISRVDSSGTLAIEGIDIVSGRAIQSPPGNWVRIQSSTERHLLIESIGSDGAATLTVVDVLDWTNTEVPRPPDIITFSIQDEDPTDDEYFLVGGYPGQGGAVFVDGDWQPDAFDELEPRLVYTQFDSTLQLVAGVDDVLWTVEDFTGINREGFHSAVADSVVVAARCEPDDTGYCAWSDETGWDEELVGFDVETGEELWSLSGSREVAVIAGDQGIVSYGDAAPSGDVGYVMIDLRTGQPVADEAGPIVWPLGTFKSPCCGEGDYTFVHRDGGVVFAVNSSVVTVWLPPGVFPEPVSTVLG